MHTSFITLSTMKLLIVTIALILSCHGLTDEEIKHQWLQFKLDHGKFYRSVLEDRIRFGIFKNNLLHIEEHNQLYEAGKVTYKLGVNQFADLTGKEFQQYLTKFPLERYGDGEVFEPSEEPAKEVDWRQKGIVTPVKNQGQCGSCFSFSTTGALEGQYKLKRGTLLSFSEQNLVDCSRSYGNYGCNGGLITNSFKYIKDHGITTEDEYPYSGTDNECQSVAAKNATIVKIQGYYEVRKGENHLKAAISEVGPIAVAIDAELIQFYSSGIFSNPLCGFAGLNHAVLAVGYGSDNDQDYWLVKNSWGESFGEKGYIKLARNSQNMCGISSRASFPKL